MLWEADGNGGGLHVPEFLAFIWPVTAAGEGETVYKAKGTYHVPEHMGLPDNTFRSRCAHRCKLRLRLGTNERRV